MKITRYFCLVLVMAYTVELSKSLIDVGKHSYSEILLELETEGKESEELEAEKDEYIHPFDISSPSDWNLSYLLSQFNGRLTSQYIELSVPPPKA